MLNIEKLRAYRIPDVVMDLTRRDTMLYALSAGLGSDFMDERQLRYVYERDLHSLPTMATMLAVPYAWIRNADVGFGGKSVHAGVDVKILRPIPVEGRFVGKTTIGEVLDKGAGKAAIVTVHRKVLLADSGDCVCELDWTNMYRGDGGFGGPAESRRPEPTIPDRAPDMVVTMPTLPQQHLVYRLNGDYNPLHADPQVATRHGFPRPILHGLCTFAVTGHALLANLCDYDASRLTAIGARFSKPVYPGETLSIEIWQDGGDVHFRTRVPERDNVVVLDRGTATVR